MEINELEKYLMNLPAQNGGELLKLLNKQKSEFENILFKIINKKSSHITNQILSRIIAVDCGNIDNQSKLTVIKDIITLVDVNK
ncbi:MAG: hypothetical protein HQK76_20550 [Desulfobacterales bacterium]|nr:hypothetical protein [Desulfobacterales bacterium]